VQMQVSENREIPNVVTGSADDSGADECHAGPCGTGERSDADTQF